jgi:hypothetical protein
MIGDRPDARNFACVEGLVGTQEKLLSA